MPRFSLLVMLLTFACNTDTSVKAFNAEPEAEITSHADGTEVYEGYVETFRGSVTDPDHSASDLVAIWYLDTEEVCAATPPADDGTTSCDILITSGAEEISLEVRDPQGAAGSDILPLEVIPTASPEAQILTPEEDGVYYSDQKITFLGLLSDGEDDADALVAYWKSDIDGVLDVEAIPNSDGEVEGFGNLTEGQHAIQLHVEDSTGKTGTASVIIDVGPPNSAPTCAITAPVDGHAVAEGEEIRFEGMVDDVDIYEDWLTVVWESDVDGTLRESNPSSDGSVGFSYGDLTVATHRVTMTVTDEVGDTCTDGIYVTVGTPPSLIVSAPTSGDVENQDEDVLFVATVSDNEDLPTAISMTWNSSVDGLFSTQGADSSGNILFSTDALSTGDHILTVRATDTDGLYAETNLNFTVNATPTAPTVSITPDPAQTEDDLVASAAGSVDPDTSGSVTYSYAWYEDGTLSSASTSSTFPRSSTTKDHTYKVVVTPNDGTGDGETGEAELAVINTDPVLTGPSLSASTAVVGDTLTCTATATDADGDTLTITYTWNDGSTGSTYTVDASDDPGDTITCTATVDDGDGGTDSGTASATVQNTAPVMDTVSVTPSSGKVGEVLTCSASATDADGDAPTISYTWSDGSTGATYTIDSGDDPGDTITCTATADDGSGGTDTGSANATVTNTDPVLGAVTITPSSANNDDTLTCTASATDADGDTPALSYAWSDATTGASLGSGSSIDLSTTAAASLDTVRCTVTATDPDGGADTGSADLTLGNRAPSVSATLSPSPATRYDTLTCTASATDDDGDTLTTSFAWTINGSTVSAASTSGLTSTLSTGYIGGDVVSCTVDADDSKGGTDTATASITISNQAPTITGVTLSPSPVYTNDTLTVSASVSDADGDSFTTTYDWYVDGSSVQNGTSNTLSGVSFFDKDQSVYVIVSADDGSGTSSVTSSTVVVSNTPPTAPLISISPDAPAEGEDLICVVDTDSSDDDGDAITYTMTWTVDGVDYAAGGSTDTGGLDSGELGWMGPSTDTWTDDTADGNDTRGGQPWACTVTPNDGDDDGATATATVTIEEDSYDFVLFTTDNFLGTSSSSWINSRADGDAYCASYASSNGISGSDFRIVYSTASEDAKDYLDYDSSAGDRVFDRYGTQIDGGDLWGTGSVTLSDLKSYTITGTQSDGTYTTCSGSYPAGSWPICQYCSQKFACASSSDDPFAPGSCCWTGTRAILCMGTL